MIAPYLVFCLLLPWCVASGLCGPLFVSSAAANHAASAGIPPPDLFLMLWMYLFLRVPRGSGGFLMWVIGITWDLCFGGQLGLGGLVGVGLWGLRGMLRLGDPTTSPVPRQVVVEGLIAGLFVAGVGFVLGTLQSQFAGAQVAAQHLPTACLTMGLWTLALWWPLTWLSGSTARIFSWNPDWTPEEAAQS